jgi:hypothetical protein
MPPEEYRQWREKQGKQQQPYTPYAQARDKAPYNTQWRSPTLPRQTPQTKAVHFPDNRPNKWSAQKTA